MSKRDGADLFTSSLADMERRAEKFISSANSVAKKMEESNGSFSGKAFGEDTEASIVDGEKKLEISLGTSGYTPSELSVDVCGEELHVSGRHEERGEDGQVMVARQFIKSYSLPQGAVREKVESNLSQDGVLVITVPKENKIKEIKSQDAVDNIQIGRHYTKSPTPF